MTADHDRLLIRRRQAAVRLVGDDSPAAERITNAPAGYLLAHDSGDVARHGALLSPVPGSGEVRVVVTPGRVSGAWHVDVAARDRRGLLAAFTGVLAERRIDVVRAVLATWDDGAALEAFVVRSAVAPDAAGLQVAFAASLDGRVSSAALPDAQVRFDEKTSPVFTACEVRAEDRPGLLHALAVAFVTARIDVHAASVATVDGVACDRFDLTDRYGRKLTGGMKAAIRAHIREGVIARRRPPRLARR